MNAESERVARGRRKDLGQKQTGRAHTEAESQRGGSGASGPEWRSLILARGHSVRAVNLGACRPTLHARTSSRIQATGIRHSSKTNGAISRNALNWPERVLP